MSNCLLRVAIRTCTSDNWLVTGREFIRRVEQIGRSNDVAVRVDAKRGKGSHVTLYYGERLTVVKDRRKEIKPGLLAAMIRQLGLNPAEFR